MSGIAKAAPRHRPAERIGKTDILATRRSRIARDDYSAKYMGQRDRGKRRCLRSNVEGQTPPDQPTRGFANKWQHPGSGKNGASTNITRDVSIETLKHPCFLQNNRNGITASRADLSNDKFHQKARTKDGGLKAENGRLRDFKTSEANVCKLPMKQVCAFVDNTEPQPTPATTSQVPELPRTNPVCTRSETARRHAKSRCR